MTISAPADVTEQSLDLVGGTVRSRVFSAGRGEPVLFLHGAGGLMWDPVLTAMTEHFTVYAPEHPGSGQSEGLEQLRDMWDLALYYDELLDALELPTVAVVGHSFGGMVAAELAANSRHRVSKLALIAAIGLWRDDAPIPDIAGIPPERLAELVLADPSSPIAEVLAPAADDPEALFEAAVRMASILHFIWPIPDKGLKRRIHRIAAPTLLLWGAKDRLVPPVYAEEFASRLDDTRVEIIEEAAHLPQLEQPTETRDHLLSFLRQE